MTKSEFLWRLQAGLAALPEEDRQERLAFYSEMIDDRMEEGLSEEEAVAQIGPVEQVIGQIIADTPFSCIPREPIRPRTQTPIWQTVLIILGSPLWLVLGITGLALVLALFCVLFALIVTLWSLFFAIGVSGIGCAAGALIFGPTGYGASALAVLGIGIALMGCSILLFLCSQAATGGLIRAGRAAIVGIKNRFAKKEAVHE